MTQPAQGVKLHVELILLAADYLMPSDVLAHLRAAPLLAQLLTPQHDKAEDSGGQKVISHLLASEGECELLKLLLHRFVSSTEKCGRQRVTLSYAPERWRRKPVV